MQRIRTLFLALGALALLAGCQATQSASPSANVPVDLQSVIASDFTGDPDAAGINAEDETIDESLAPGGIVRAAAILPDSARILWWRRLTSTHLDLSRSGTPDSMYVTSQRANTGLFSGRLLRRGKRDSLLYQKPYGTTWSRAAVYKKIAGMDGEFDTQWMLWRVSLAHNSQTSPSLTPPAILKVEITGKDQNGQPQTATFNDPDALFDPNALPEFAVGDSIQVRVFTGETDATQRAYLHFPMDALDHPRAVRRPMTYNGTDAFVCSFRVREGFRFRVNGRVWLHPRSAIWVDVLTKSTIYDTDPGQYAASGWGVPFRLFRPFGSVTVNP